MLLFAGTSYIASAQEASSRSNPVSIKVKSEDAEFKTSKVYAVIIGVSDYQDPNIKDLKYADADAQLYYNFLRSPQGGSVPEKNITLLLNKNATRANIIKALNNQFSDAFEEDLAIVYIACHGLPTKRGNKLFFLGTDTDRENLEGSAVSQSEFDEAISSSRAQKKVWIADACHSGTVVGTETAFAGSTMRGEREIAEATMVNRLLANVASAQASFIVLSASSAGETSVEAPQWGGGHGVFTYYLVEGLKGAADENKNKLVDIREIYEYVRTKVSEETSRKQYPLLNGRYAKKFPMSAVLE
ncbi:caspase family protein [Rhodocytophaga rosea]|uniref:Caspase family protein n=1 Tax=Rhodocytophaga rosea TaxID=2704465 RepID=A0A6C0GQK9_9BACT|nr:caspase family protein [Rhodocytophaga rosea]QHT69790.1 caspase family protein [Rhodocytophaga rosea]